MVVIGTKPEYFNAVWVRNEWSRYLALIKNGERKVLIPAYRDMDPYDLPEEFSHLQAQDMSKLGFMQDLIRGIKKLAAPEEKTTTVKETVVVNNSNINIAPLLKRAFMFLEDCNFKEADEYCEKVLDQDPENAQAYLGKLMAEMRVRKQDKLRDCTSPTFDNSSNYEKALRFGSEKLRDELREYSKYIEERNENSRKAGIYERAVNAMNSAYNEKQYQTAIDLFKAIPGYKDSDEKIIKCQNRIEELRAEAETARIEKERRAEQARIKRQQQVKKMKKTAAVVTPILCVCIAFAVVINTVIIPKVKYDKFIKNLPNVEVGDTIEFGEYEQDNKSDKEPIEWNVLDIQDNKALIISKYGLDAKKYNEEYQSVTWENCTLRKWLNEDFYNEAFSSKAKM